MPDTFTREKRSEIMSKIRSKGTKIELIMKGALEESGIVFQYQPKMFGKPDFLIAPNIVIFCDSSFWHGRDWNKLGRRLPKGYWREHIDRNRKRDRLVNLRLKKENFVVLRFWDKELERDVGKCIAKTKQIVLGSATNEPV
jgi:DNA mismatch endonuclease (patch repair protein)